MGLVYSTLRASLSPIATWRLGESSGVTAVDATGNGHDGTYTNSAGVLTGVTLGQTGAITGDTNKAVLLDGVAGFVSVPDSAALRLGTFAIEAWVKCGSAGGFRVILCKGSNAGASLNYYLDLSSDGIPRLYVTKSGSFIGFSGATGVNLNQYNHVVGTYDGANLKQYLNGQPNGSISLTGAPDTSNSILAIGEAGPDGNTFLAGTVDEVSVYPALSAANVLALFNAANAANPVAKGSNESLGLGIN